MEDKLIKKLTAVLAKEKGFNNKCIYFIDVWGKKSSVMSYIGDTLEEKFESCNYNAIIYIPTQSLLQKWLREIYSIHFHIYYGNHRKWCIDIYNISKDIEEDYCAGLLNHTNQFTNYNTYEEALEIGLLEALKTI